MEYTKFQEYIDAKGKLQNPVVSVDGDTTKSGPKTPEAFVTKGKNWEDTAALKSKQQPYSGPGTDPGLKSTLQPKYSKDTIDQGLLYKGDKELVYEPGGYNAKETTRESWPKSKTEQFIDDTKELSTLDFIDRIKEKIKLEGIPAIREAGALVSDNENLMETLIREIKRNGGFSKLMQEVLNHQEAYSEIALSMNEDESVCNQLARAIRETTKIEETTAAPAGEDIEEEEETEVIKKKPMTPSPYQQTSPEIGGPPEMPPSGDVPATQGDLDVGEPGMEMPQQLKRQHVMMRREHNLIKALQRHNII